MLIAFALGLIAGTYALGSPPAEAVDENDRPLTYTVESGSLGRTIEFPAVARWEVAGQVFAPAGGTLTEIVHDGVALEAGDIVIRVDERPLVVVPGPVPAFRPLELGMTGRDVAALNAHLASLGYAVDADAATFDAGSVAAVRAWQERLGLPPTGSVQLGDVLFIEAEHLDGPPFRVAPELAIGAPLPQGAPVLERLEAAPSLVMEFSGNLPDPLRPELEGIATYPDGTSVPVIIGDLESAQGRTIVKLTGLDGGPACEPVECLELVPTVGETRVTIEFVLVPPTRGPVIPAAALQTDADGDPFVSLADGSQRTVDIVVTSGGLVIVEGVEVGETIQLP